MSIYAVVQSKTMIGFVQEVRHELARVTWPTRAEVIRLTGAILLISLFIGIYLGAVDFVFTRLLEFLIK